MMCIANGQELKFAINMLPLFINVVGLVGVSQSIDNKHVTLHLWWGNYISKEIPFKIFTYDDIRMMMTNQKN